MALTASKLRHFKLMYEFGTRLIAEIESDCRHLLENKKMMEEIRSKQFDFAVMDPIAVHCYYVIPYSLDIPYATMSVSTAAWSYRVPRLPSFASSLGYSDVMTFTERLKTLTLEVAQIAMAHDNTSYLERHAPNKPIIGTMELFAKSALWFFVEDLALGYARPLMPNTASVGDLMAGQSLKDLPLKLRQFMKHSPDGGSGGAVIIVSFGSFFDHVPRDIAVKFCDAFRSLKQHKFIWKLKYPEYCPREVASNVLTMTWIPQNDLLADERVRLFISHGGFNSLIEAVYHAKPVIVFPIALDQPNNAAMVQAKGIGIRMNLAAFTADELTSNIQLLLNSPNIYTDAVHHSSAILRDKPDGGAAQRVSFLIDHVTKYGHQHLRTGAFQLTTAQFFMFDIFAFLLVVALLGFFLVVICTYFTCLFCSRKFCFWKTRDQSLEKKQR